MATSRVESLAMRRMGGMVALFVALVVAASTVASCGGQCLFPREGCQVPCPSGSICVRSGPERHGVAIDLSRHACVHLPTTCNGVASCDCMGDCACSGGTCLGVQGAGQSDEYLQCSWQ